MRRYLVLGLFFILTPAALGQAPEGCPFVEAKHGKGELRFFHGIPVTVVQGTPSEIGEQFGALVAKPSKEMMERADQYLAKIGRKGMLPFALKIGGGFAKNLSEDSLAELEAVCKASGLNKEQVMLANSFPDLLRAGGCSTIIVDPHRSSTKGLLFGRLLDWAPYEGLPRYSSVVVFRPDGKHAFAVVTIGPVFGCLSGMNDAGLCLTMNEINKSKDKGTGVNFKAPPMLLLMRKVLEECTTLDEAEKVLKDSPRSMSTALTACDMKSGCVFEVTTKTVIRRTGENGICCCTNHFRTDELSVDKTCPRYDNLEKVQKCALVLGIDDVVKELDRVSAKEFTVQAMIFEPKEKILHVSIGIGESATAKPMTKLELAPLFAKGFKD